MANDTLGVDQERTTESNTRISEFDVVRLANLMLHIGNQRVGHSADPTVIDRRITPGDMRKL